MSDHPQDRRNIRPKDGSDSAIPDEVQNAYAGLGSVEPPALIDQAILNKAHAAVDQPAREGGSRRPWSFGWPHALSTVAVMVLGITILLQLRDQAPAVDDFSLDAAPMPAPSPASGAVELRESAARQTSSTDAAMKNSRTADSASEDETTGAQAPAMAAPVPEAADQPAAPAALMRSRAAPAAAPGSATTALSDMESEPAPAREEAPPVELAEELQEEPQEEFWEPATRLLEITALLEAGEREAAQAALGEFQARWPDYPLPPALLELAAESP
jgi:hypothetical protein